MRRQTFDNGGWYHFIKIRIWKLSYFVVPTVKKKRLRDSNVRTTCIINMNNFTNKSFEPPQKCFKSISIL